MQDKFNSLYPYRNTPGFVTYRLYRFRDDRSGCQEHGIATPAAILAWAESFDDFHGSTVHAAVRFLNQADGHLIRVEKLSKEQAIAENGYYGRYAFEVTK